MKQIYICQHTGKQFDNELDCQESEYINGDERKKFVELIHHFVDKIEKLFKIEVKRDTLDIYDKLENYYNDRMIHWRHVGFTFILNGRRKEYYKTSDRVGDGRWEWDCKDDLDDLVRDFEKEHLLRLRKKFEGKLTYEHDNYRGAIYSVGNQKLNDILGSIKSNKKIRIEVID